jgi:hypothetical protein
VGPAVIRARLTAHGTPSIRPLEEVDPAARDAVITDAAGVLRFLGLPRRPAVAG